MMAPALLNALQRGRQKEKDGERKSARFKDS